jgi:hypothetical protein
MTDLFFLSEAQMRRTSTFVLGRPKFPARILHRALKCVFKHLDDHRLFHHEATAVLLPDFSAAQNVVDHASIATKHDPPHEQSDRWCSGAIGNNKHRET